MIEPISQISSENDPSLLPPHLLWPDLAHRFSHISSPPIRTNTL